MPEYLNIQTRGTRPIGFELDNYGQLKVLHLRAVEDFSSTVTGAAEDLSSIGTDA